MNSLPWHGDPAESSATFSGHFGTEALHELSGSTNTHCLYAGSFTSTWWLQAHVSDIYIQTASVAPSWPDPKKTVFFSVNWSSDLESTVIASKSHGFTGKPYSETTGLYYSFQRWYDPETGRFISQDLVSGSISHPQTLNRYTYVANSPTNYVDPWDRSRST